MLRLFARFREDSWRRATSVVALALVAVYFFYAASKFRVAGLATLGSDAGIIYQTALWIAANGKYPAQFALGNLNAIFPYPPPAVLMFAALGQVGPTAFMIGWEIATFVALYACARLCVQHEADATRRAWPILVIVAILLAYNPIEHDLASRNDNLVILAVTLSSFALLRHRPVLSGIVLSFAIALKLYSGLLLVWLIVFDRRAAASCIAGLVALWVVAPALYWGAGVVEIYRGWFEQLAIANESWVYALPGTGFGPPLITLRLAASKLLGSDAFATDVKLLLLSLQGAWLCTLAIYGYAAWRGGRSWSWRSAWADWSVLLLAPLPFSPWLEPYHAVALIPGFLLCVLLAADSTQGGAVRATAALGCLAAAAIKELSTTQFEVRGLIFLAQFVCVTLALSAARPSLAVKPAAGAPVRVTPAAA